MNRLRLLAAILLAATAASAAQAPSTPPSRPELTARLERAVLRGSGQELRTIRAELLRSWSPTSANADQAFAQYALAYVGWRMANLPDVPEREQGDLLDDAVTRLQGVVKNDTRNAEAHALLGSIYGIQAGRSPIKAMVLGPRASSALDRAAKESPDNPRVVLLQGMSAFFTPAMFGGGVDKAERLLRRGVDLFSRESATTAWPNWGRFDVHAWLGQALLSKGDRTGARAEYDKAMAIAPDSGWLRFVLIPALERSAKP